MLGCIWEAGNECSSHSHVSLSLSLPLDVSIKKKQLQTSKEVKQHDLGVEEGRTVIRNKPDRTEMLGLAHIDLYTFNEYIFKDFPGLLRKNNGVAIIAEESLLPWESANCLLITLKGARHTIRH